MIHPTCYVWESILPLLTMSRAEAEPVTSTPLHTLIILLDGAADHKIPELGNRTPLGYLRKPFIDTCASCGSFGWTDARAYTHLFLLEFFSGRKSDASRGLVEAIGMDVGLRPDQVAYRFSPAKIEEDNVDWVYRISEEKAAELQHSMVKNLRLLKDLNPRLYFYEDGRGVMTVDSSSVMDLPNPPSPLPLDQVDMGDFEPYIMHTARENDGLTAVPWGGGTISQDGFGTLQPSAIPMVTISRSPSALGVGRMMGMRSIQVEGLWSGFRQAFRLLKTTNVFLHVEETDDISHKKAPMEKVALLREVDQILKENVERLRDSRIAFIIDHGTSSITGEHIRMKVPFAVSEAIETEQTPLRFCEDIDYHVPLTSLLDLIMEY